jgi:hypothetical protein
MLCVCSKLIFVSLENAEIRVTEEVSWRAQKQVGSFNFRLCGRSTLCLVAPTTSLDWLLSTETHCLRKRVGELDEQVSTVASQEVLWEEP